MSVLQTFSFCWTVDLHKLVKMLLFCILLLLILPSIPNILFSPLAFPPPENSL